MRKYSKIGGKNTSNGTFGERLAEYKFKELGWVMFRHQPATRMISIKGKPVIINVGNVGIADYTGYWAHVIGYQHLFDQYVACEVKESSEDTMPASRLSKQQRDWMKSLPIDCSFVCVVWTKGNPEAQIFPFQEKGSYKRKS